MKTPVLILLLNLAFTLSAGAQEFKKFKVLLGLGYGYNSDFPMGLTFSIEPTYRLHDALSIGVRLEDVALVRMDEEGAYAVGVRSYAVNGQYYFSGTRSFRPFVGVGLGYYEWADVIVGEAAAYESSAKTGPGLYPRVGFDLGHFTMSMDYDLIPGGTSFLSQGTISYLDLRIAVAIGGGKK